MAMGRRGTLPSPLSTEDTMDTSYSPSAQERSYLYRDIHSVVGEMVWLGEKLRGLQQFSLAAKILSRAHELQGYARVLLEQGPAQVVIEEPTESEEGDNSHPELPF